SPRWCHRVEYEDHPGIGLPDPRRGRPETPYSTSSSRTECSGCRTESTCSKSVGCVAHTWRSTCRPCTFESRRRTKPACCRRCEGQVLHFPAGRTGSCCRRRGSRFPG